MRRLAFLAGPIVGLLLAGAAFAAPPAPLSLADQHIGPEECTPPGSGAKIAVDVRFTIVNYGDSGYADEWALDTVKRHLRIWKHTDGTYCAHIDDAGSTFTTLGGPSPASTGFVQPGTTGTFMGGYVTTDIVGQFKPAYAVTGNLGTFDARCDRHFNCPGARPSWLSYFKKPQANEFANWAWLYDAGAKGKWLDAQVVDPGRNGDIRG